MECKKPFSTRIWWATDSKSANFKFDTFNQNCCKKLVELFILDWIFACNRIFVAVPLIFLNILTILIKLILGWQWIFTMNIFLRVGIINMFLWMWLHCELCVNKWFIYICFVGIASYLQIIRIVNSDKVKVTKHFISICWLFVVKMGTKEQCDIVVVGSCMIDFVW